MILMDLLGSGLVKDNQTVMLTVPYDYFQDTFRVVRGHWFQDNILMFKNHDVEAILFNKDSLADEETWNVKLIPRKGERKR